MLQHVFISYCRDNKEEVAELVDTLTGEDIDVWWDQKIKGGQTGWIEVRQSIKQCYAFVLCLSKEFDQRLKSGVFHELLYAIRYFREHNPGSIYIIPVRLSECEIPFVEIDATRTLEDLQYIDLFPNRAEGIAKLVESINAAKPSLGGGEMPPRKINPAVGSEVPKTCDRGKQEGDFVKFLEHTENNSKNIPRVCIIHGNNGEAHESLVERFRLTRIKNHAKNKYGDAESVLSFKEIRKVPLDGDLDLRKRFLLERLFLLWERELPHTPDALGKLLASRQEKVIIIQHNVYFPNYDATTVNLLEAYLNFWDEALSSKDEELKRKIPEIFIFFNVIYPLSVQASWLSWKLPKKAAHAINKSFVKKALRKKLDLNVKTSEEGLINKEGTRIMLKELPCVIRNDVILWFDEHGYSEGELFEHLQNKLERMFTTVEGKILACRCMADIEPRLAKIVKSFNPRPENL